MGFYRRGFGRFGCGRRFVGCGGGYGYGGYSAGNAFALIVVLFILLIIIGAAIY